MSEIIDIENPAEQNRLSIYDDSQLDLYFKIHQKVNEKSEEIYKSYKNNILV